MNYEYRDGTLHVDGVDLRAVADAVGTPCYVYSRADIESRWRAYDGALAGRAHRVCYAVKANHNLSVLRLLARLGSGFDIVSAGELERVLAVGAPARDVVFAGVGKTEREIERALGAGVGCINVESAAEAERVGAVAERLGAVAPLAVRVNPDVDAGTHPYISTGLKENKFGVPADEARVIYEAAARSPSLRPVGIACHIGSQLVSAAPVVDAVRRVVALAESLRHDGIELAHVDVGGGLGVTYRDEQPPDIGAFAAALSAQVPEHYEVVLEPGRSLVAAAGVLVTRVEYVKQTAAKRFLVVDAAMNDLLRPALYQAWHAIRTVAERAPGAVACDVVGPVCESGDWLARERYLDADAGDLLAIGDAGAYGHVMASNYNSRPRPPEVLLEDAGFRVIRPRETLEALLGPERACLDDR